jgi:hypothetical protein
MPAKFFQICSLIWLLNIAPPAMALTIPDTFLDTGNTTTTVLTGEIADTLILSIKRGEPYDEKKDPALRKGTENQEEPQLDFFIIPLVMFVGMGLFLYFNKL